MLNSISTFSNQIFLFSKETIVHSLSDQQKRILLIVSAAFGFLAACYLAIDCYNTFHTFEIDVDGTMQSYKEFEDKFLAPKIDEDAKKISISSLEQAIELMFTNRGLEWGVWVGPFTDEEQTERYKELKKAIEKILPQHINEIIHYRDGMNTHNQTLLLQAIMHIKEPSIRLEIVKILLEKGADPRIQGFYYDSVEPMIEAKQTEDQQLIELLTNAINDVIMQSMG